MLWESVPKMSHEAKRKGLAWLQALDFLSGAAGDRTPDLMTARLGKGILSRITQYQRRQFCRS
jgi:hypothetical protein